MFVSNQGDDTISILDISANAVAGCIAVADEPFGIVVSENYIYVTNQGSHSISIIDKNSFSLVQEIDTESAP